MDDGSHGRLPSLLLAACVPGLSDDAGLYFGL